MKDRANAIRDESEKFDPEPGHQPVSDEESGDCQGHPANFRARGRESFHNRILEVDTGEEGEKFQGRMGRRFAGDIGPKFSAPPNLLKTEESVHFGRHGFGLADATPVNCCGAKQIVRSFPNPPNVAKNATLGWLTSFQDDKRKDKKSQL